MSFAFKDFADSVKAGHSITARDTLALRQWQWADGQISEAEANSLFDLNDLGKSTAPEWIECFVEAISEYVVNTMSPKGYVSTENAAWLMARIDKDGRVDTLGELELLVKILEKATNAPDSLKTYALSQIEKIVLTGTGVTRDGGTLRPATVDAADVKLLRRLLFAQASDGPAAISRAEAEALFRIKDASLLHNNAPEWQTLFVQALGHHLMAHTSYIPLAREEAARLEAFMDDTRPSIGNFFGRLAKADFGDTFRYLFGAKAPVDHDADVAAARAITPEESAWLKARLDADAVLDPIEKALLAFVAAESGQDDVAG
jgi:hypothetical protein